MPVVGGCNHHHVHVLAIQKFPKVLVWSRLTVRHFDSQIAIVFPHITNGNDIHFGHELEVRLIAPAHSTHTDAAYPNSVIWPGLMRAFRAGRRDSGTGNTGSNECATIHFHNGSSLSQVGCCVVKSSIFVFLVPSSGSTPSETC